MGLATPLIAWPVQDDLPWAPRFVQAPVFFQIIACLAFASGWRLHPHAWARDPRQTLASAVLGRGLLGAVGLGIRFHLTAAPLTAEIYRLRPLFRPGSPDRADADSRLADFGWVAGIDRFVLLKRRAGKTDHPLRPSAPAPPARRHATGGPPRRSA